jgi:hypothetical protein
MEDSVQANVNFRLLKRFNTNTECRCGEIFNYLDNKNLNDNENITSCKSMGYIAEEKIVFCEKHPICPSCKILTKTHICSQDSCKNYLCKICQIYYCCTKCFNSFCLEHRFLYLHGFKCVCKQCHYTERKERKSNSCKKFSELYD